MKSRKDKARWDLIGSPPSVGFTRGRISLGKDDRHHYTHVRRISEERCHPLDLHVSRKRLRKDHERYHPRA